MSAAGFQDRTSFWERVPLSDLALRHREFLSISWKDRTPAEISEKVIGTYGFLPFVVMQLRPDQMQCDVLHRARWVDPGVEDISDPITFSYPRHPGKQIMGRANLPGIPVFYTCGSARASFAEARSGEAKGQQLIRSEWQITDQEKWLTLPMIAHEKIDRSPFHAAWQEALREYILRTEQVPQEYILLLHDLLADLFLQENYEVTSWIAHSVMQEKKLADMMIYPSLRTGQKDLCHAFKAAPIDAGRIQLDRVEQVIFEGQEHRAIKHGTLVNDRIEWKYNGASINVVPTQRSVTISPRKDLRA